MKAYNNNFSMMQWGFDSTVLASIGIVSLLFIAACQTTPDQPRLYPNAHLTTVGQKQAELDIDDCMALARDYGVSENKEGRVGEKAAAGAVIGGASAGAWGLVRGDAGSRAAAGAASGAAGGAAAGAVQSTQTSPTFKNFVQRCLAERGYEVIGWQ